MGSVEGKAAAINGSTEFQSNSKYALNLPRLTLRQFIVMWTVILAGSATSSYNRLLGASMPDLRGIWGLDMDEGSLLLTLALAPQLLLAPITPWLAKAFGIRKTVLPSSLLLIGMVILIPFLRGFVTLVAAHAVVGALLGVFITRTVAILYKILPISWMIVALAFYAYGLTLGTNSAALLSAIYIEQLGWWWIYWQMAVFMVLYFVVVYACYPRGEEIQPDLAKNHDFAGMIFFCLAVMLFYVGLSQGEQRGWLDSELVACCFLGAGLLFVLFCFNEAFVQNPWAPPHYLGSRNVMLTIFLVGCYAFVNATQSTLLTGFLQTVQGHKPEQIGWAMLPVPLLHLFFIPVAIILTRFLDGRLVFALGACCFAVAYWLGTFVTVDWVENDFLPLMILFSMAIPLSHLGMMSLTFLNFRDEHRIGILAFLQVARVTFPALSTALIAWVERVGRDTYTYRLQEHLVANDPSVLINERMFTDSPATVQDMVATEASVLAFQDAFQIGLVGPIVILVALFLMRPSKANPVFPIGI